MRKLIFGVALLLALLCMSSAGWSATHVYSALLQGLQEVPANASPATGQGLFVYDDVALTLQYNVTFSGLSALETGAHIHGPAVVGVNAGVIFPLPAGSPKIGVWNMTATQAGWLTSQRLYVNVHSQNFPGGEIRGQIIPEPSSLAALGLGACSIILTRRRRR